MVGTKLKFVMKAGVALFITMMFLEAFLRFSGTSGASVVTVSDDFGLLLKPNADAIFVNEGFTLGKVNKYGYVGPGFPPDKPPGVTRIALMGDSYVAGRQLLDRHHFRTIMEDGLNRLSPKRVEVLNFGYPSTNFEQMFIYYHVFAARFSPDFVLYFIDTGSLNGISDEVGPRLKLDGDSLFIDYSFRKTRGFARLKKLELVRSFAMYSLLRKAKETYARGSAPEIILDKFHRFLEDADGGNPGGKSQRPEDPKRMPINRAALEHLARADRTGSPTSIIVVRDELAQSFIDFATSNGVLCFDPSGRLDSLAAAGIEPHYWKGSHQSGHWNQYAHRVIGNFLIEKMAPLVASPALEEALP